MTTKKSLKNGKLLKTIRIPNNAIFSEDQEWFKQFKEFGFTLSDVVLVYIDIPKIYFYDEDDHLQDFDDDEEEKGDELSENILDIYEKILPRINSLDVLQYLGKFFGIYGTDSQSDYQDMVISHAYPEAAYEYYKDIEEEINFDDSEFQDKTAVYILVDRKSYGERKKYFLSKKNNDISKGFFFVMKINKEDLENNEIIKEINYEYDISKEDIVNFMK